MSGETKLNKFLEAMDSWLASKSLPLVDDNPQIKMILNLTLDIQKVLVNLLFRLTIGELLHLQESYLVQQILKL